MKKILLFFTFLIGSFIPAHAFLQGEGFYWFMEPEGDAAIGISGFEGTEIDLKDDFGYGDTDEVPGARLILGNTHQLGVSWLNIDTSSENTIDRTIRFSDLVFSISEKISTQLDLTFIQGFYRINLGAKIFHGGLIAGGQYIFVEAAASSPRLGSAKEEVEAGMPFLGVFAAGSPFPFLGAQVSLTGGSWDFEDVEADYFDFEGSVWIGIPPGFYGGAGYRQIEVDAREETIPIEAKLSFSGPLVFVGFEW